MYDKKWYTKIEIMAHLKISQSTLQRIMQDGLPFITNKQKNVYNMEEVGIWIAAHEASKVSDIDRETLEELKKDIG